MLRNVFEKEVEIYKRKKKWKFLKYNNEVSLPGQEVNSKQILVIRVYSVARREKPVLRVVFLLIEAYNRYYTDYHKPCFPLLTILTHLC